MTNYVIINDVNEFFKHFILLKRDSQVSKAPNTYVIGFSAMFVHNEILKDNVIQEEKSAKSINSTTKKCMVSVLLLASQNVCLAINLSKIGFVPEVLLDVLKSENWIKYCVGVDTMRGALQNSSHGDLNPYQGAIDLNSLARACGKNLSFLLDGPQWEWIGDLTREHIGKAAQYVTKIYYTAVTLIGDGRDKSANIDQNITVTKSADLVNSIIALREYANNRSSGVTYNLTYEEIPCKDSLNQSSKFCVRCKLTLGGAVYCEDGVGSSKKEAKHTASRLVLDTAMQWDYANTTNSAIDMYDKDYVKELQEYVDQNQEKDLNRVEYIEIEPQDSSPPVFRIRCDISKRGLNKVYTDNILLKTVGNSVVLEVAKQNAAKDMLDKIQRLI